MAGREKTRAGVAPSRGLPLCRVRKYETVNGIMGNTHGVKIAASPAVNAVSRKNPKPEDCGAGAGVGAGVAPARNSVYPAGITIVCAFAFGSMVMVATAVLRLGGRHMVSLQH